MSRHIFVFGSNLAGRHGAGSAKEARLKHGAQYGVGYGPTGHAYAIPTKDEQLRTLPLDAIKRYVRTFLLYARAHPELTFDMVKIGCGLAGYSEDDMRPLFVEAPRNVNKPKGW